MFKPTSILLALVAALQLASIAESHSRLLEPRARNGGFIGAFDGFVSPACGGDGSKNNARPADATYRRGQSVPIVWPRNNHPGGFISIKVVPFNGPQAQADFDRNIIQYACHESGCKSGFAGNPLAGDNMPEDTNRCSTPFTVPAFLPDGQYTLQWHWYGGGSFFGDVNRGQTDYYGCHDFTVAGGSALNPASKPRCPTFIAGDAHNPASSRRCKFFGTGSAFSCRPDGCRGTYQDGIPKALEQCLAASGGGNPTPPPAPAPQPPAQPPAPAPQPPAPRPQPPAPAPQPQPQPQPQPNPPSNFENLQRFQGALFNLRAPVVRNVGGSRPFIVQLANGEVNGNFNAVQEALGRSCDVQANQCANRVNGAGGRLEGKGVGDCDGQRNECKALIR